MHLAFQLGSRIIDWHESGLVIIRSFESCKAVILDELYTYPLYQGNPFSFFNPSSKPLKAKNYHIKKLIDQLKKNTKNSFFSQIKIFIIDQSKKKSSISNYSKNKNSIFTI